MKTEVNPRYSIGQFAMQVHLTPATLRYYESLGLLKPRRDQAQRRYYQSDDLAWVAFLRHLKGTGMTMSELQQYVKLRAQGNRTINQRVALLKKVKKTGLTKIKELESNLMMVQHKLDWYQGKQQGTITDDEDFAHYLAQFKE